MNDSDARKVNLRIRFAGLNLFVPDRGQKRVHVLMPSTDSSARHSAEGGHDEHGAAGMSAHPLLLHWMSGGVGNNVPLDGKHLVLRKDGWPAAGLQIPAVFDLAKVARVSGCTPEHHGKVDLSTTRPAASLILHSGNGRVVNPGGEWTINGKRHGMPTVMDWWVHGIDPDELMGVLQEWDVFGGKLPDVGKGNNVNLWIIHAPSTEQRPEWIGSTPVFNGGRAHFHVYYQLLLCDGPSESPKEPRALPDPGDPNPPEWARQSLDKGAFLNCMLAQAEMIESSGA